MNTSTANHPQEMLKHQPDKEEQHSKQLYLTDASAPQREDQQLKPTYTL